MRVGGNDKLDIYRNRPISGSDIDKLDLQDINFKHDITLEVPCFVAYDIAKVALAQFNPKNVKNVCLHHFTYWDGSEKDVYASYGHEEEEHIIVEISHHFIDPHFLWFWLWIPDVRKKREYPDDHLFDNDVINEAIKSSGHKFGEIYVAPCTVRIRTVKTNPTTFLPPADSLQKLVSTAKEYPHVRFWNSFIKKEYELATYYIGETRDSNKGSKGSRNALTFLGAVQALCYLLGKQSEKAVDEFLLMGIDFHAAHLERYSDLCYFFAVEAAKEMDDLNQSVAAMKKIAQHIPGLTLALKGEISDILVSYAASVYLGTVVLCRRVLETVLTKILVENYEMPIEDLIKECCKAGELRENVRRGLFAVLMVAKWKKVLTSEEFQVASNIKDFGDRIHSKNGLRNVVDAKYALQACIHILRRVRKHAGSPN